MRNPQIYNKLMVGRHAKVFPTDTHPPPFFFVFFLVLRYMDPCTHRGVYTVCVYIAEPILYASYYGLFPIVSYRERPTHSILSLAYIILLSIIVRIRYIRSIIRWLSVFPHLRWWYPTAAGTAHFDWINFNDGSYRKKKDTAADVTQKVL